MGRFSAADALGKATTQLECSGMQRGAGPAGNYLRIFEEISIIGKSSRNRTLGVGRMDPHTR